MAASRWIWRASAVEALQLIDAVAGETLILILSDINTSRDGGAEALFTKPIDFGALRSDIEARVRLVA